MKVKKEGIKPSTWRMDVTCSHCKADLSVGYKDMGVRVINKNRILLPNKRTPYFTVRCCKCRTIIYIKPVDIPLIIREAIIREMSPLDRIINFYL